MDGNGRGGIQDGRIVISTVQVEKVFLFFYPHTLTFRLKRPVYRGFSGEGKCEGKLSPLTPALTLTLTLPAQESILSGFLFTEFNKSTRKV